MATNSNVEGGPAELARNLGREIQKRVAIDVTANAAGSACTSPATSSATPLEQTLAACWFNVNKSSPRSTSKRSYSQSFQVSGGSAGSIGPSPSGSISSDSCGCSAGYLSSSSREMSERNNGAPVRPFPSQAPAASVRSKMPIDLAGNGPQITLQAAGGEAGGPKKNSPSMAVSKSGKHALTPPAVAGIGKPKVIKPRRARKSKKPTTRTIEVPSTEFRATVQRLTGLKSAATPPGPCESGPSAQKLEVVNPQIPPVGVQATATAQVCIFSARPSEQTFERNIAIQSPPAGLDSATSSLRSVRNPTTGEVTVLPELPFMFSYREESTSGSDLNSTMGFDHQSFLELACSDLPNQQVEDRLFRGPAYSSDVRDAAGFPPESREPSSAKASLATASSSHPRVGTADTWKDIANQMKGVFLREDPRNHVTAEEAYWPDDTDPEPSEKFEDEFLDDILNRYN